MKSSSNVVPRHVGIILDGNRRLAKRLMVKPWKGHEWGAKKVRKLFEWAHDLDVKELTLYCFSLENFDRPKQEFDYLMKLFKKEFKQLINNKDVDKYKVRVNFIGRLWKFDQELQGLMNKVMEKTKEYSNYVVNFAIGYGGQQEVVDAVKKIASQVQSGELNVDQINEETFADALWLKSEPDLIVRTGGDKRTSNFLNFQSAYSEWIFLEKYWPEFEKEDLIACVDEFAQRKRRFGK